MAQSLMAACLLLLFSLPCIEAFKPRNALVSGRRPISQACSQSFRQFMFFAEGSDREGISVGIAPSSDDKQSISEAAKFLVDSFWLDGRHLVPQSAKGDKAATSVSDDVKESLYLQQAVDLMEKYGERMGKRLLNSCILTATENDTGDILALLCVSTLLFDSTAEKLITYEDSEQLLKVAVAGLGPKERRKYKDASVDEIASNLLGENDVEAVCCISNLAVSPNARRLGIASKLCEEAERIASVAWGNDVMVLKVESDNTKARNLYEKKLNYVVKYSEPAALAYRVDAESGQFVESRADTLLLVKRI